MSREEVSARLREQVKEVQKLKRELEALTIEVQNAQRSRPELDDLRKEIDRLKREQKELAEEMAKLPPKYRVPERPVPKDTLRHLTEEQRLFPPPNDVEKITGRVHYATKDELICHPLPGEQPQICCGVPEVLARVTFDLTGK